MSAITSRFSPASSSEMLSPGCATIALRKLRTRVSASTGSREALTRKQPSKAGLLKGAASRKASYCPSHAVVFAAKTNRFNMRSAHQKSQTPENKKTDRFKMPCLLSKAAPGLAKPVAGGAPAISSLTKKGPALHAPGPLKSKKIRRGAGLRSPASLTL